MDVAVSIERHVGARAVWDPATVTQLFCAFAEPDAIGLSSVLGQLSPVARHEPHGVTARLSPDAARQVLAPIAPGLVVPVGRDRDRADPPRIGASRRRAGRRHRRRRRTRAHLLARRPARRPAARRRAPVRGRTRGAWPRAPASACSDASIPDLVAPRIRPSRRKHMTDTVEQSALTREAAAEAYRTMRTIREFEERLHVEFADRRDPRLRPPVRRRGGRGGRRVQHLDDARLHRQHPPRPRPLHRQGRATSAA